MLLLRKVAYTLQQFHVFPYVYNYAKLETSAQPQTGGRINTLGGWCSPASERAKAMPGQAQAAFSSAHESHKRGVEWFMQYVSTMFPKFQRDAYISGKH